MASFYFSCLVFLLSFAPIASARPEAASEDPGQETSVSQTQATMASLFGRGAKMPGIPRIYGTIALPAFDNSGMKIDEGALDAGHRQGKETRD